jgi:BMFP domain-containing protein YqiC
MSFLENLLETIMKGDIDAVSEKQILLGTFYELKSLNDKVTILEKKIDESTTNGLGLYKELESVTKSKLEDLNNRLVSLEQTRSNHNTIKEVVPYIGGILGIIALIAQAIVYFK